MGRGKKTVRWNQIERCDKCLNLGIVQRSDYYFGDTYYAYCDCFYGKKERKQDAKESHKASVPQQIEPDLL